MSYADVCTREASWFQAVVSGLPALDLASGGPFDLIAAYPRRISQRPHQLYVWRSEVMEKREALSGTKSWTHHMVAEIVWASIRPTSEAHLDLADIDVAVDKVLQRIRGAGDATHGLRFWDQPGGVTVSYGDVMAGLNPVDAPTSAGLAWVVRIHYPLVEMFTTAAPLQSQLADPITVQSATG